MEAALEGPDRYLDLRLDLTNQAGASLLTAGGCWDQTFGQFLDPEERDARKSVVVQLQESQYEFVEWFAGWLADFREGRRGTENRETQVAMLGGDRRGGKTFIASAAVIAACVDVPISPGQKTSLISWVVCKSFRERFELEQWILTHVPSGWYRHRQAPEHEFLFHHGPVLRLLSADDPDALRQGRVDIAFVNEPQKMAGRAVANIILGASDLNGLVILACNPPRGGDSRGEWLFDVKEKIDDDLLAVAGGKKVDPIGIKYFHVDSKKNKSIDQIARHRAGRIVTVIDPSLSAGDVEGEWRRPQEKACWEFDKHRHLHLPPDIGLKDITHIVASEKGDYGKWSYVGGVDFDQRPFITAVIYKIFGDPDDPLFCAVDEFVGERRWTTAYWIETFSIWGAEDGRDYNPSSLLWIGDASSGFQGDYHDRDSDERTSFEVIEGHSVDGVHWTIIPPQDSRGKTGKARNPFVSERLDVYNDLLRRDKMLIDPAKCIYFAECNRRATTERQAARRKLKHNEWAHGIDAGTYPIYRLAPRPGTKTLPPGPGQLHAISFVPRGPRVL